MEIREGCFKKLTNRSKNNLIFAIFTFIIQIVMSIMYGYFIKTKTQFINIGSIVSTIFTTLLVVAGFGLYFSYLKHLIWTSLGFNLLITAFCIQLYPLINALWTKIGIFSSTINPISFDVNFYSICLAHSDTWQKKGNVITGAIRCSLSLIVAFSSLIGRIGSLQCLFLIIFGSFGFQINRQLINNNGQDAFGSFSIFTFGSFLGLAAGIILKLRENNNFNKTNLNSMLQGTPQSGIHSVMGALLIFALLPMLAYEMDNSTFYPSSIKYNGPLSIILSMGSGVVISIACLLGVNGLSQNSLKLMNILSGVIAGGLACGSASYYITTPFLALICGLLGAMIYFIFDNLIVIRLFNRFGAITTYSFSLFAPTSLIAAIVAAGFVNRLNEGTNNNFQYQSIEAGSGPIVRYFISAGIGLATGTIVGILMYLFNNFEPAQMFHDRIEWRADDGIQYSIKSYQLEPTLTVFHNPQPKPKSQEKPPTEQQPTSSPMIIPPPVEPSETTVQFQLDAYYLQQLE